MELAGRQGGVISARQLLAAGLTRERISAWARTGRLHRLYPGVYALGHRAVGIEGRLHAGVLYAGRGVPAGESTAAFSHTTAAWLWRLIQREPRTIHLSVPGRRASLPDVRVHQRRRFERTSRRCLPVTAVAQTLLDCAATLRFDDLRRALAQADYRGLLDIKALDALLGARRPGGAALRRALVEHRPELAHTNGNFEDCFLFLCERHGVPIPKLNFEVEGILVDAFWPGHSLVVELDGKDAHSTHARIEADRRKELSLRSAGFRVQRYTWFQLTKQAGAVADDVKAGLARVRGDRAARSEP